MSINFDKVNVNDILKLAIYFFRALSLKGNFVRNKEKHSKAAECRPSPILQCSTCYW